MNADFVRCCDFLARMIEKYGPEIREANTIYLKSSEVDCWKYNPKKQKDRIFFYAEKLDAYQRGAA